MRVETWLPSPKESDRQEGCSSRDSAAGMLPELAACCQGLPGILGTVGRAPLLAEFWPHLLWRQADGDSGQVKQVQAEGQKPDFSFLFLLLLFPSCFSGIKAGTETDILSMARGSMFG